MPNDDYCSDSMRPCRILKPLSNNCRKRLQNKFDDCNEEPKKSPQTRNLPDRSVLSVLSLNDNTRRVLRNSTERLTKALNNVRTTFGMISQKFRISTKRRQILEEGPMTPNCNTPHTVSRQILGRTPTKLYSPFGIETPQIKRNKGDRENIRPHPKGA